jgi:ubiquinone/menaquinone biosynthesis C-methylase UbiE
VTPPDRVANPFAASGIGGFYDHGRPYHHPRSLARILAAVGAPDIERALDIACGTGMSTVALAEHAATVVGVDLSPEMLGAARRSGGVHYLLGNAERMPVTDASFDAATCCSGVHWFDQARFFGELKRVLRPGGWVGLYDHYFTGEMIDVPEFAAWLREAFTRFPLPPRNPQVGDPRAVTPEGFEAVADEFFGDDIELTHEQLADYQLTISNFVDAFERGAKREDLREWVLETTASLFAGAATRTVRFVGSVTCLRVA